jgi:hypothetical protein
MCNLYSMTKNQDAIRRIFRVTKDSAGNDLFAFLTTDATQRR